jgi:hypothetical protein
MACMDGPSAFAYGKHATGMGGFCFDFASEESSEGMQSRTEKNILLIFGNLFPLEIKRLIAHIHFDLARYETVVSYLSLCLCKRTVRCQLPVHYIRHTYGTQPSNRSIL